jgi:phosphatidylinositol alpha-mannosyltransferase
VSDVLPVLPTAQLWMATDVAPPVHPSIRHFPAPDDDELAALYRAAWVFAYPSTYEGFGLPYIEAMASGTAVVATRCDAAERLLANDAGRVVTDAELGAELVRVLTDPATRQSLESRGLERARRFAWSVVAEEYRTLHAAAVQRGRSG